MGVFLVGLLGACGAADAGLPPDAAVLPGTSLRDLLGQCSRGAPEAGEATWQPGAADIAALEAALPAALRESPPRFGNRDWSRAPEGWRRQYAGIIRGGRRTIYGNFFPSDAGGSPENPDRWRLDAVIICDGGPAFFGVEYDVVSGRILRLDFNGMA